MLASLSVSVWEGGYQQSLSLMPSSRLGLPHRAAGVKASFPQGFFCSLEVLGFTVYVQGGLPESGVLWSIGGLGTPQPAHLHN